MDNLRLFAPYLLIMGVVWVAYVWGTRRRRRRFERLQGEAHGAGPAVPTSLHPVIDPVKCLGCATCTHVCPEGDVLGVVNGKATLIDPGNCIGHGACKSACPTQAIRLVFGTAERGVDLPVVGPDFQSNVPGIFVAGELGGMGLVRNAIEQGRQAIEHIARQFQRSANPDQLDVLIVGAGPAGFSAALGAKQQGLRYVVVEQDDLGGTVFKYPRGKIVMTAPAELPLVGRIKFRKVGKEELLTFWKKVEKKERLNIRYRERVTAVRKTMSGFDIATDGGSYQARTVLLAIGRRGSPRMLGVPGEQQAKVVYGLVDAAQYAHRAVLVVGGGDSAMEAAVALSKEPGCNVSLSYRGKGFSRAKRDNREALHHAVEARHLTLLLESEVKEIGRDHVLMQTVGNTLTLPNDAVIVCAGGVLPTDFLRQAGLDIETKYGTA
jgi:thioredoxin reductase (NADPH)